MRSRVPTDNIRIGTSGWSYPSGQGSWNGLFYPPRGRAHRPHGFDELSYYAEHFNTVEVNSSFYGIPTPEVTQRWVERDASADDLSGSAPLTGRPSDCPATNSMSSMLTCPAFVCASARTIGLLG